MHATLPLLQATNFPALTRKHLSTLQVNLGYRCNQSCVHCHVDAGPHRTEMMSDDLIDTISQVRCGPASTWQCTHDWLQR